MKFLLGFLSIVLAGSTAADLLITNDTLQLFRECNKGTLTLCLKEKALKYVQDLPNNIDIDGISIRENNVGRTGRHLNPPLLPDEPTARENALNNILMDRILNYFSSHTFEFKLPSKTIEEVQRSIDEARKKKKGKGGDLMGLIKLKLMAVGAIVLKLVALVAFKALMVAKIALLLASALAVKKLLESKHTSTYEVVAHPHYEDYHHHDRSFAQELAYRGYADDENVKDA